MNSFLEKTAMPLPHPLLRGVMMISNASKHVPCAAFKRFHLASNPTEPGDHRCSSGQKQSAYLFQEYCYSDNMAGIYFSKPFNHSETFRSHPAATLGGPRRSDCESLIWKIENPLLFYTSDLHLSSFLSLLCSRAV